MSKNIDYLYHEDLRDRVKRGKEIFEHQAREFTKDELDLAVYTLGLGAMECARFLRKEGKISKKMYKKIKKEWKELNE